MDIQGMVTIIGEQLPYNFVLIGFGRNVCIVIVIAIVLAIVICTIIITVDICMLKLSAFICFTLA